MRSGRPLSILLLAVSTGACDQLVEPPAESDRTEAPAPVVQVQTANATGQFTQTAVTSVEVRSAGRNTIIEQTSEGVITGTLSGSYVDDLTVVIHPDGKFNARFTISCECTVEGRQGVVEMVASDHGELISPDVGTFAGRVVINGGTDELSGVRGLLRIEGTVDVPSGLSTYGYEGTIRFVQ